MAVRNEAGASRTMPVVKPSPAPWTWSSSQSCQGTHRAKEAQRWLVSIWLAVVVLPGHHRPGCKVMPHLGGPSRFSRG